MMKHFREIFRFERRRFFKWWNLIILGGLFLAAIFYTLYGIGQYRCALAQKEKFLEIEKKKIEQYINYRVFGFSGFQVTTLPIPESIFFTSSSPFPEMTTVIDTSERLKIFSTLQAGSAFKIKRQSFSDVSGVFLIFGSFIFFLYGFETFLNTSLIKVLSSSVGLKRVFINIVLSRMLLITIYCAAVLIFSYLLVLISGVSFPLHWSLLLFLAMIVSCSLFFFALGAFLGTIRPVMVGLGVGILVWFLLIHVVPNAIDTIVSSNANSIKSVYETELKKLKILTDAEKRELKKAGQQLDLGMIPTEIMKENALYFLNNDLVEMQKCDEKMISEMDGNVSLFSFISSLFPTSHYMSVNMDLSRSGYLNLMEFYRFIKKVKKDFYKKFLDKVYFSGENNAKVEPFLKDNENLLKPTNRISINILWGILLSILYTFILFGLAYKKHRKNLFALPQKTEYMFDGGKVVLDKNEITEVKVTDDLFQKQMYCLFSGEGQLVGEKGFDYKVILDEKDLTGSRERMNFLYLCNLQKLPGNLVSGDLVSFFMRLARTSVEQKEKIFEGTGIGSLLNKRIGKLDENERTMIIIALIEIIRAEIYLLNDVAERISLETALKLKSILDRLPGERHASVLFIFNDRVTFFNGGSENPYFKQSYDWSKNMAEMENAFGTGS